MAEQFFEPGDGRRIAYCRGGGTEPGIVFLGGFSSNMEGTKALHLGQWASRQGRAFLRFDYTGHGRSSGRFEDGCIGDWAGDAADAVFALTEGPQILVGSSMGGWIGLLLASRNPGRVAGMVGIAAAPDFTDDFRLNRLTPDQHRVMEQDGRVEMPSEYSDEPMVITRKLIEEGPDNFLLNRPLELPMPVRLLQGTEDADVDQSVAVRLLNHASCPDARLLLVRGADHSFSSPDCLELIEQAIESILDTIEA